jgi:hypothetical protein
VAHGNVARMPLAAAPLVTPVRPLHVIRAYRDAPPFAAGGHRSVRLRARPHSLVGAPCAGRVTFVGAVAAATPTVTIQCDAGLRLTLAHLTPAVRRGTLVGLAAAVGEVHGGWVGLSARMGSRYRDPIPLLSSTPPRAVPPGGAALRRRPPALPRVMLQRPVRVLAAHPAGPPVARAEVDRWTGSIGAVTGMLCVLAWAWRARPVRRLARGVLTGHRLALRR